MSTTKKPQKAKESTDMVKQECTEGEKARIAKYNERVNREPIKVKYKPDKAGNPQLQVNTTDRALTESKFMETFGTPDRDLQQFFLNQVIHTYRGYVSVDETDYEKLEGISNSSLALLNGIQPQDEVEGMLAVQMVGVHNMAMEAN